MAIMIDPKGLLRGKRLRKFSHMPRLYYPYILSLTNFYARVELDVEIIYNDLATINDPDLSETQLEGYFKQYEKQGLCFIYQAKGSRWAQFDTPVSLRRSFSSAEDDASAVSTDEHFCASNGNETAPCEISCWIECARRAEKKVAAAV